MSTTYSEYFTLVSATLEKLDQNTLSSLEKMLLDAYHVGGTIYIFGNGGSGATASHIAGDFIKGASYGLEKRFRFICLNDNNASMMAIANDISYDDIFVEPLKNFAKPGDLVIGISGSGNSENVVKALEYAEQKNIKSVAMCGFKGGKIKAIANLAIHADVMNMEVTEDIHLIVFHSIKQSVISKLAGSNTNMGAEYEKRVKD